MPLCESLYIRRQLLAVDMWTLGPESESGHGRGGGQQKHQPERGDVQGLRREAEDWIPPSRPPSGEHAEEDAETNDPRTIRLPSRRGITWHDAFADACGHLTPSSVAGRFAQYAEPADPRLCCPATASQCFERLPDAMR